MVTNVKWTGMSQFFGYVLQFVTWVIMARILPADNFGALGIALAFTNAVYIFGELGMSMAIIQRKDITAQHCHTTFWTMVLMTLGFLAVVVLAEGPVARYFHNALISDLMVLTAVRLVVESLGGVHEVLLKRELRFHKLALIEMASWALFGLVAVSLTLRGYSIVALAIGYLAKSILKVILLWLGLSYRPAFVFDRVSFFDLFNYGKNVIGYKTLSYFASNIAIFLIGRLMGSLTLGYYSLAMSLVNFPREKISSIVAGVAFPAMSKLQEHPEDLRQAYEKLIRYAAVVNFPLLIGLLLAADPFVRIVYTAKWAPMVLPLKILCLYGLFFSLTTLFGTIYNAKGRPVYTFWLSLGNFLGTTVAVFVGFKFGLVGVAVSLVVQAALLNLFGNLLIRRLLEFPLRQCLVSMRAAVGGVLMMALVLFATERCLFFLNVADAIVLVIMVLLGAAIYLAMIFILDPRTFQELLNIVQRLVTFEFKVWGRRRKHAQA